ncbi:unnamed protein product [Lactuca saligna]|uniref:Uncharacterized protein n=1 Tax=Lactuca saligna TaxID=75948 RepID=A0AA35ZWJ1_LACSI|nr:unnamed protein product [Lactuca saligna]
MRLSPNSHTDVSRCIGEEIWSNVGGPTRGGAELQGDGIIPPYIGNLSNLKLLYLSSDRYGLMVDDMAWTSGLFLLEHLDLSLVHLSGEENMDMLFYMLYSLKELSLKGCGLSNAYLGMMPSLSVLHLSDCRLEKTHLSSPRLNFTTHSKIQHLDLSGNLIHGTFPSVFTNMSSLRVLDLSENMLNSLVPVMPNLLDLAISYN